MVAVHRLDFTSKAGRTKMSSQVQYNTENTCGSGMLCKRNLKERKWLDYLAPNENGWKGVKDKRIAVSKTFHELQVHEGFGLFSSLLLLLLLFHVVVVVAVAVAVAVVVVTMNLWRIKIQLHVYGEIRKKTLQKRNSISKD